MKWLNSKSQNSFLNGQVIVCILVVCLPSSCTKSYFDSKPKPLYYHLGKAAVATFFSSEGTITQFDGIFQHQTHQLGHDPSKMYMKYYTRNIFQLGKEDWTALASVRYVRLWSCGLSFHCCWFSLGNWY